MEKFAVLCLTILDGIAIEKTILASCEAAEKKEICDKIPLLSLTH